MTVAGKGPEDGFVAWPGHTGNWGRWDNDRGTMNLITPDVVRRAAAAVRQGRPFQLARPLTDKEVTTRFTDPFIKHEMIKADADGFEEGDLTQSAADKISSRVHGMKNTHIDALVHMGYRGWSYNGYRFPEIASMEDGVTALDIEPLLSIVTRGVFLDVARNRGVEALDPGEVVQAVELEPLVDRLEPGDAAVLRIGGTIRGGEAAKGLSEHGVWHHGLWSGFDTDCVDLLASHDVAVMASDSPSDAFPHRHEEYARSPVHVMAEVFYGMPLVHNMDLEALAAACHESSQDTFMFTVAPLYVPNSTGSLVAPTAVL